MQFHQPAHPVTGVVVPVSALKSDESLGVGEFLDLIPFGRWAKSVGLSLIQILPVNDTGTERSPYSALSAFALHPLLGRIQDFPEAKGFEKEILTLRKRLPNEKTLDYELVLLAKLDLTRKMWDASSASILVDKNLIIWFSENPWVRDFALFSLLREEQSRKSWLDWTEWRDPSEEDLNSLWKQRRDEAWYWVWLQWRLEQQFSAAAEALDRMEMSLKGDIPILINDDSADVWASRRYFRLDLRAGSPPDHESPEGQYWGFPTYDWDQLEQNDYCWWKDRLSQAAKFYHAYRIDHVLGFFRIWAIPEKHVAAVGGHFAPSAPITEEDLHDLGWDEARVAWMTQPHIPGDELRNAVGDEAPAVAALFQQVGDEDLWRGRFDSPSEQDIVAAPLSDKAKQAALGFVRNLCLRCIGENQYVADWNYSRSRAWNALTEEERHELSDLINRKGADSQELWEETGRRLLSMMMGDGSLLVCAEDLGGVPDCVPKVLGELGILSLKVTRWSRRWNEPGQPYIQPKDYPALSVTTSSVHDATTMRQWLAQETDGMFREAFGFSAEESLDNVDGRRRTLEALQDGESLVAAYPLQDFLCLDPNLTSDNPDEERINVPGTVESTNWVWRMLPNLEDLSKSNKLNTAVEALARRRESRPVSSWRR